MTSDPITLTGTIDTSTGASGGSITFYYDGFAGTGRGIACTTPTLINGVGSCIFKPAVPTDDQGMSSHYKMAAKWFSDSPAYNSNITSDNPSKYISVAGVSYLSTTYSRPTSVIYNSTSNVQLVAQANIPGKLIFKVNGETITADANCSGNTSVAAKSPKTCTFTPASSPATQTITVDLIPDDLVNFRILTGQKPLTKTLDNYYLPNSPIWPINPPSSMSVNRDLLTIAWYANESSTAGIKGLGYTYIDGIFYKLNRANSEAMVIAYDRFYETGTSIITIPDYITPTLSQLQQTGETGYAAFADTTYAVTGIGPKALAFPNSQTPGKSYNNVLVTPINIAKIILPNTLKIISTSAFEGSIYIRELRIPDSVTDIGPQALKDMTGLETLTVGSSVTRVSKAIFTGDTNLRSLTFRGAEPFKSDGEIYPVLPNQESWQSSQSYTRTSPIMTRNDHGSTLSGCSALISYGPGNIDILSGTSAAWAAWADGCLSGNLIGRNFTPSPPQSVIASNPTLTSLLVGYTAPESNGGAAIIDYKIEYTSNGGATWTTATSSASTNSFTVSGLTSSTSYKFRVSARNSEGYSDPSNLSSALSTLTPTAPAAPVIGVATAYDSRTATVSFTAPTNDGGSPILRYVATGFPGGESATIVGAGSGTISVTGLTTNIAETFTVVAINAYGTSLPSAASNSVTPLVTTTPPAPAPSVPASSAPVPDPAQNATITSYFPKEGAPAGGNTVTINLNAGACKPRNISIDGRILPIASWSFAEDVLTLTMPAHAIGVAEVLIYNGCIPVLNPITYVYREPEAEIPAPVVVKEPAKVADPVKEENVQPTKVMRKIGTIYFASGSYLIDAKSKASLRALAKRIAANPALLVLSYGHTDSRGGVDNTVLSKNRAKAAAKVLRSYLTGQKIITGWFAASKPIAKGSTAQDLAKNRRVEIYIK